MELSYRRHRFPPVVIQHAVWLYLRFTLSYRDVEDLLAERGLDISYETVRSWVLKFGPVIARRLRRGRPRPSDRWHLDEMVVRIAGKRMYLWRAVDHEGEVLDMLVQRRRDTRAVLRLMPKLLRKQGFAPKLLVTDKLRSYGSAFRRLRLSCPHEQGLRSNNRAENSHQPVRRRERKMPSTPSRLAINAADLPSRGGERAEPADPRPGSGNRRPTPDTQPAWDRADGRRSGVSRPRAAGALSGRGGRRSGAPSRLSGAEDFGARVSERVRAGMAAGSHARTSGGAAEDRSHDIQQALAPTCREPCDREIGRGLHET
jgi:putative transposase